MNGVEYLTLGSEVRMEGGMPGSKVGRYLGELSPSVAAQRNLVGQLEVHSQKVRYGYKEGPFPSVS